MCTLCPHHCEIADGNAGLCGVRVNTGGELLAESYGRVTSLALDPIEKKPLYHFHPGSKILSIGSYGCNMKCSFCQNHRISQENPEGEYISPEELARLAADIQGNIGVAFTYNEPLIWIEYIMDAAPLIRRNGQSVILVSNGQINAEPLEKLIPLVDAWNIDVKAFSHDFYRKHRGDLDVVKHTVEAASAVSHVEVTTLIIPGENDGEEEVAALTGWLSGVSEKIPYHLSRFFPRYKMADHQPTPRETLVKLVEIAGQMLRHVHIGNL